MYHFLGRDSQGCTEFSRAGAEQSMSELTEERRLAFLAFLASLAAWAPGQDPDVIIPGTYSTSLGPCVDGHK